MAGLDEREWKMKDIRVELRIKNNALYKAIMAKHRSVAAFARESGVSQQAVGQYLNFKLAPITKQRHKGGITHEKFIISGMYIKHSAAALAKTLGCSFFDIFPPVSYEKKDNFHATEIDSTQMIGYDDTVYLSALNDPPELYQNVDHEVLTRAVDALLPREKAIVSDRFGMDGEEKTLDQLAAEHGVSRERVRQIERKALRKLRRPFKGELKEKRLQLNQAF
jgi:RNA polymerase sigma factor (sigma-70 family)